MKVKHVQQCPICRKDLKEDTISPMNSKGSKSEGKVFICCAPLADDPLHYYNHLVFSDNPDHIFQQEFSVNIGSRYVMFYNDYQVDKSWIKSNIRHASFEMPVLLLPDFPTLDVLKRKIRMYITFS